MLEIEDIDVIIKSEKSQWIWWNEMGEIPRKFRDHVKIRDTKDVKNKK